MNKVKKDPLGFLKPGWGDRPALSRYGNNEPVLDAPGDDDADLSVNDSITLDDAFAAHNQRIAQNCFKYGFQR